MKVYTCDEEDVIDIRTSSHESEILSLAAVLKYMKNHLPDNVNKNKSIGMNNKKLLELW